MARVREKSIRASRDEPGFVTALARGLELLSCYTLDTRSLGNGELAKATGLPKTTVSRLTYTLCSLEYLKYNPASGEYSLGPRALRLGSHALHSYDIRRQARPFMRELAHDVGMMCGLGAFDGTGITVIVLCRGSALLTVNQQVGYQLPLEETALGLAYLCGLEAAERDALVNRIYSSDEDQRKRVTNAVQQALEQYRTQGFIIQLNSRGRDIHGCAVPLTSSQDGECYSLNLAGPSFNLSEAFLREEAGPKLVRCVQQLQNS